jgi:hypothetical protein
MVKKKNALFTLEPRVHQMLDQRYGRNKSQIVNDIIKKHLFMELTSMRENIKIKKEQILFLQQEVNDLEIQIKRQEEAEREMLKEFMPLAKRRMGAKPPKSCQLNFTLSEMGIHKTNEWVHDHWEEY